jgi:hypothetical protein
LDDWIYWHLIHITWNYRQYGAVADYTFYSSPLYTHYISVFTSRILATIYNNLTVISNHTWSLLSQSNSFPAIILQLPITKTKLNSIPKLISRQAGVSKLDSILCCSCQSQSHIATDGQSVSKSWSRYLLLFDSYGFVFCGAPSLTRGRVCLLYMLLAPASAVFLGSEFLVTRNHILLSQFWYLPFRRLLRLAGSRWRYSTPPPHGLQQHQSQSHIATDGRSVTQSVSLGVEPHMGLMIRCSCQLRNSSL